MNAPVWQVRTRRKVVLALIGVMGAVGTASAVPPTLNTSGLSPEQCYRKDSDCTRFCGDVTDEMRYECFSICDRMLDRCLSTGDWTDSLQVDPGTGKPPGDKTGELAGLLIRMMMILGDTNGDGSLSVQEIQAVRTKVFGRAEANPTQKPPATKAPAPKK